MTTAEREELKTKEELLKLAKEYKSVQSRDDEGRYVIPEEKRTKAVPKDGYKVRFVFM